MTLLYWWQDIRDCPEGPTDGPGELGSGKGGWVCCWESRGWTVAKVVLGYRGSGVPGVCSCAVEKASDLQDALPKHHVYPRLSRPQSQSGMPAIHAKRQRGTHTSAWRLSISVAL